MGLGRKRIFRLIFVLAVLGLPAICFAQRFSLGKPTGDTINFKPMEQYMDIKLTGMNLPQAQEPTWYEKIFLHRKAFGLGYIEVKLGTKEDSPTVKTMVFNYERESSNRYKYESLGISPTTPVSLSKEFPFPVRDQVQIRIVVKNYQDKDNISLLKRMLSTVKGSGLQGLQADAQAFTIASVAFGIIENLFPPSSQDDEILITVGAEDITHQNHSIMFQTGNNVEFELFKLSFVPKPSLLPELSFAEALKTGKIGKADSWEDAIREANKLLDKDGISPLLSVLRCFAKDLRHADLAYKDKVLFLAQAIHTWASTAVEGYTYANEYRKFSASNFRSIQMSSNDRDWIRGTDWDFPGGECNTPQSKAVADFIAKYVRKDEAALEYIRDRFSILFDKKLDYAEKDTCFVKLRFGRDSGFEKDILDGGTVVFKFDKGKIPITYNDQEYWDKSIKIYLNEDKKGFYVNSIEVF